MLVVSKDAWYFRSYNACLLSNSLSFTYTIQLLRVITGLKAWNLRAEVVSAKLTVSNDVYCREPAKRDECIGCESDEHVVSGTANGTGVVRSAVATE